MMRYEQLKEQGQAEVPTADLIKMFPHAQAVLEQTGGYGQFSREGTFPCAEAKIEELGGTETLRKFFEDNQFRDINPIILKACSNSPMVLGEIQRFWGLINSIPQDQLERALPLTRLQSAAYFLRRPVEGEAKIERISDLTYVHPSRKGRSFLELATGYITTPAGEAALLSAPMRRSDVIFRGPTTTQLAIGS